MGKIAVVGSANIDMTATVQKFPEPGETLRGEGFETFFGGKGANQAVAASRLGGDVAFVGRVGDDTFGSDIMDNIKREGIDTTALSKNKNRKTGVAIILVNRHGENKIVIIPGANESVNAEYVQNNASVVSKADIAISQLEIPMEAVIEVANVSGKGSTKFILDPAPTQEIPDKLFNKLFLITPNQSEAKSLTGVRPRNKEDSKRAADVLHKKGVQNVIITLGDGGAFFSSPQTSFVVQAPSVQAKDTTAAGDVFNGALAVALCRKSNWEGAINFACAAASKSVLSEGAQGSIPSASEISASAIEK